MKNLYQTPQTYHYKKNSRTQSRVLLWSEKRPSHDLSRGKHDLLLAMKVSWPPRLSIGQSIKDFLLRKHPKNVASTSFWSANRNVLKYANNCKKLLETITITKNKLSANVQTRTYHRGFKEFRGYLCLKICDHLVLSELIKTVLTHQSRNCTPLTHFVPLFE